MAAKNPGNDKSMLETTAEAMGRAIGQVTDATDQAWTKGKAMIGLGEADESNAGAPRGRGGRRASAPRRRPNSGTWRSGAKKMRKSAAPGGARRRTQAGGSSRSAKRTATAGRKTAGRKTAARGGARRKRAARKTSGRGRS